MSDDRLAHVRAEAWKRYPEGWDPYNEEAVDDWGYSACQRLAFQRGVEWADDNPRPCTITLAQSEAILEAGRTGRYEDHEAALRAAGIEVEDNDE